MFYLVLEGPDGLYRAGDDVVDRIVERLDLDVNEGELSVVFLDSHSRFNYTSKPKDSLQRNINS